MIKVVAVSAILVAAAFGVGFFSGCKATLRITDSVVERYRKDHSK